VSLRFSAAAHKYDAYATVQNVVAEQLLRLITPLPVASRVLEAGCGSGQLTRLLLKHLPHSTIDALDISERMIQEARRNTYGESRVQWMVADTMTFQGVEPYPLIVSSSSLHWTDPLETSIRNLTGQLEASGHFVFALMLDGTLGELREARLSVAPSKKPNGRLLTKLEVDDVLDAAQLHVEYSATEQLSSLYPSTNDFLRTINRLGLTGGQVSRSSLPLTRGELRSLKRYYTSHFGDERGSVKATYRIAYYVVRKQDPA